MKSSMKSPFFFFFDANIFLGTAEKLDAVILLSTYQETVPSVLDQGYPNDQ